ncbi:hypothetical protein BpHYR1_010095 [Brachionus plicatilis]|uniref:Uncharacterized protein n=1 Tax=Brachionus plicatilis TaxID=10195 RepID=A0A3M7QRS1_BRAPC|nr:hypothetical protein BpHYR1_010095 [Brachionus plicatilis]
MFFVKIKSFKIKNNKITRYLASFTKIINFIYLFIFAPILAMSLKNKKKQLIFVDDVFSYLKLINVNLDFERSLVLATN